MNGSPRAGAETREPRFKKITVVYDGECPVCSNFVLATNLRSACEELVLADARQGGEVVERLKADGIDLNETMAACFDDELYVGHRAIEQMAEFDTDNRVSTAIVSGLFKVSPSKKLAYRLLVACRKLLLFLSGRKQIGSS